MSNTVAMEPETIRRLSDEATKRLLNKEGTASSTLGGWMMIATILIEAWDLYAIAFVLIFVKADFNPTPFELGLATAAVQGGALFGALFGGILADYIGRKRVFVATMALFIVLAIAQAFSARRCFKWVERPVLRLR
jgi:MFS family permease